MRVLGRLRYALSAVMLAVAALSVGVAPSVFAEEEIPEYRLQISPATLHIDELEPGETEKVKFRVQNTGSKEFDYEITVTPYSVSGTDYRQDFSTTTHYTDIAKWVTFSQTTGTVEAGGQDEITATITVPQDVPAGGQYAAIMVRMLENEENSNSGASVSMYKQLGLVMYTSVEGETREEGKVLENKVPSFMFNPPISATSIVENTGNVHFEAEYILQVFPLFSDEEIYTNEDNPATSLILPETQRFNTVSWEGAPRLGIFKVRQTVRVVGQPDSVTEKMLFICPIWFMFIVLLIIFLIIFWIISRVRGRRV